MIFQGKYSFVKFYLRSNCDEDNRKIILIIIKRIRFQSLFEPALFMPQNQSGIYQL